MGPKQPEDGGGGSAAPLSMQRSRWATRKLTVKSSSMKRLSLVTRKHNRKTSTEKKRASGGSESLRQDHQDQQTDGGQDEASNPGDENAAPPRQIYFNTPLPPELKDDDGTPLRQYPRNKIRTAKYTPLSFVPKNLWFQFHNIANIFFLFLIILAVSRTQFVEIRVAQMSPCRASQADTS